jgi:hypothetical protein
LNFSILDSGGLLPFTANLKSILINCHLRN